MGDNRIPPSLAPPADHGECLLPTVKDLLTCTLAFFGFALFLIPPGYIVASLSGIARFKKLSLAEQFLWSVSLSTPLAILIPLLLERHFPARTATLVVWILAGLSAALFLSRAFPLRPQHPGRRRHTVLAFVAMGGLAIYCLLATVGIQVGHRLFEGVASGDWSVRVPLVSAAIHSAVPPINPFYGIDGQTPQLRYYYYWYVLCGEVGRLLHASPRAVLVASSSWSGLALFSSIFLCFKYLFRPIDSAVPLGKLCLLSLPVSCILGLDILPAIIGLFQPHVRVFPEMEWWRSNSDFALSFHTAIVYAPHHTAGLVCGMVGFIVLTLCVTSSGEKACTPARRLLYGAIAGVCFAAAAGTSTYITLFFVLACVLFSVERLIAKDWLTVAAIALSGLVAVGLSTTYIHEIMSSTGASVGTGTAAKHGTRFLSLYPRNWQLPYYILYMLLRPTHTSHLPYWLDILVRFPIWVATFVIELGFFGFVLAYRLKEDWTNRRNLTAHQRLQWILCLSFGFCALFVTSAPVIGVNDLGRHAGLALRLVAVLWATPLIARALWNSEPWPILRHQWLRRTIIATIFLGLATQLWQVVMQRTYLMFVDSGHLAARAPFPYFRNIGFRYYDTREAFRALDRNYPPDAAVQFNPLSKYRSLMTLYLDRRTAAADYECFAPFGGDAKACSAAMPSIQALFGGSNAHDHASPYDPGGVTQEAFDAVCLQHHLVAVIATASDRVWPEKASWVYTAPLLYGNSTIRVLSCPKASSPAILTEPESSPPSL